MRSLEINLTNNVQGLLCRKFFKKCIEKDFRKSYIKEKRDIFIDRCTGSIDDTDFSKLIDIFNALPTNIFARFLFSVELTANSDIYIKGLR